MVNKYKLLYVSQITNNSSAGSAPMATYVIIIYTSNPNSHASILSKLHHQIPTWLKIVNLKFLKFLLHIL